MEMKGDHLKCQYLSFNIIEPVGFFLEFNNACKSLGDIQVPTMGQLKKYTLLFCSIENNVTFGRQIFNV